jgi:hypothetical protein
MPSTRSLLQTIKGLVELKDITGWNESTNPEGCTQ